MANTITNPAKTGTEADIHAHRKKQCVGAGRCLFCVLDKMNHESSIMAKAYNELCVVLKHEGLSHDAANRVMAWVHGKGGL